MHYPMCPELSCAVMVVCCRMSQQRVTFTRLHVVGTLLKLIERAGERRVRLVHAKMREADAHSHSSSARGATNWLVSVSVCACARATDEFTIQSSMEQSKRIRASINEARRSSSK
jgi:hypothetical protein